EIPSQFLVFAGLSQLLDATKLKPRRAGLAGLLAGLTLGASAMARIDAFIYLPAVLVSVFVVALMARRASTERAVAVRLVIGTSTGLAATGVLAVADA